MTALLTWRLRAFNTATESANKMHDDSVARTYGFAGGLVPGVDVYAYLTHVPVEHWGVAWLERGHIAARFVHPVYDGDEVVVSAVPAGAGLELTLTDSKGAVCASAVASLPSSAGPPPPVLDRLPLPSTERRPPASRVSLVPGSVLGAYEAGFHAEHAQSYLDDVRETLTVYSELGVAHPGWLLRPANYVLSENVLLGPWIHVSSDVQMFGLVHDGDALSTRAQVVDVFEKKGHEFVTLDVMTIANDDRVVMTVEHTAIYEPRRSGSQP